METSLISLNKRQVSDFHKHLKREKLEHSFVEFMEFMLTISFNGKLKLKINKPASSFVIC